MALICDALRQSFMPKHEYESLREEEKACHKLQKPFVFVSIALISLAVLVSSFVSLKIVFSDDNLHRPFCSELRIQPLSINFTGMGTAASVGGESNLGSGAFVMTDQETVDYYWKVVFDPSVLVFAVFVVYLVAGITVAYTAPARHGCLKVVENTYCASRRGDLASLTLRLE